MFSVKVGFSAITLGALVLCYPQFARAESFTSAQFLEWPVESQRFYFQTSIGMAGLIARQNKVNQGSCIDDWYFRNEVSAQNQILDVMRDHPKYHPHGVILAVLEKRCGALIYR